MGSQPEKAHTHLTIYQPKQPKALCQPKGQSRLSTSDQPTTAVLGRGLFFCRNNPASHSCTPLPFYSTLASNTELGDSM